MAEYIKPFFTTSVLCEKVLQERDNVISVVRIVDIFYTRPEYTKITGNDAPIPAFPVKAFFVLKGGPGDASVKIVVVNTEGKEQGSGEATLQLEGGNKSHNIVIDIPIPLNEVGQFYLTVDVNGATIARMPYEVRMKQTESEKSETK